MIGRKILATALSVLALGAVGCGGDDGNTPATDGGTSGGDGGGGGAGQTLDFVITRLSLDSSSMIANRGAHGFNVDSRFSPRTGGMALDCEKADAFSPIDADQNMGTCTAGMANGGAGCQGGVDNQLPEIAETVGGLVGGGMDIGALVQEQITEGSLAVILRVEGVNGTPGPTLNDDTVTVKLYPFAHPMFASCASIGMPNQPYQVDPRSVEGNDLARARFTYTGRIRNGRLQVTSSGTGPGFSLGIPVSDNTINLNLFSVAMRFNLADGSGGNLGGMVLRSDLAATLAMPGLLPPGIMPATVNALLGGFVDIATDSMNRPGMGSCDMMNAGGIGAGLGFEVRPAMVNATVAARPMTGTCGAGN